MFSTVDKVESELKISAIRWIPRLSFQKCRKILARWRWWSILVLSLSFSPYYFLFLSTSRLIHDASEMALISLISILSLSFSGYIFFSSTIVPLARKERREIRKRRLNVSLSKLLCISIFAMQKNTDIAESLLLFFSFTRVFETRRKHDK